jgi:TP901 family phage tail tape measure protein
MAKTTTTELELLIRASTEKLQADLDAANAKIDGLVSKSSQGVNSLTKSFTGFAAKIGLAGIAIGAAKSVLDDFLARDVKLKEFSAITGITGEELGKFHERAVDLSNVFGTSAIDNIESFKGVLSRLGPDFASSGEAVKLMGEHINTLALASGMDAAGSMDALTTAMLQFGVDLSDPLKAAQEAGTMMNVMAAGAKEGAAEIPQISEALTQVGMTAKGLNVSFVETNALLQTLAQSGKYGSEAGVALRNVLVSLTTVTNRGANELKQMGLKIGDVSAALTAGGPRAANNALEALRQGLQRLPNDAERAEAMVKIFGKENLAAAQAVIYNIEATDKYIGRLKDTQVGAEQAAINMSSMSKQWDIFTSKISNFAERGFEGVFAKLKGEVLSFTDMLGLTDVAGAQEKERIEQSKKAWGSYVDSRVNGTTRIISAIQKERLDAAAAGIKDEKEDKPDKPGKAGKTGPSVLSIDEQIGQMIKSAEADRAREKFRQFFFGDPGTYKIPQDFAESIVEQIVDPLAAASGEGLIMDALIPEEQVLQNALGRIQKDNEAAAAASRAAWLAAGEGIAGIFKNLATLSAENSILYKAAAVTETTINTYASATAAYKAMVGIPVVGPILAPIAAGAAIAAGLANVAKIASLDVGTTHVPRDQYAKLHAGEAVLPRSMAEGVRRGEMAVVGGGARRRGRVKRNIVDARVHISDFASMSQSAQYESMRRAG